MSFGNRLINIRVEGEKDPEAKIFYLSFYLFWRIVNTFGNKCGLMEISFSAITETLPMPSLYFCRASVVRCAEKLLWSLPVKISRGKKRCPMS